MKDYERIALLKKERLRLIDDRNCFNADMNGWFTRMEKEKMRFAAFEEEFNTVIEDRQALLNSIEGKIMDLEAKINNSVETQISDAHIKVGHEQCNYCFQWFNKNGLASHKKACGMNPEVQQKKPEKALEKIEQVIENGNGDLEASEVAKLLAAKQAIEARLAEVREKVKEPEPEPEPEGDDIDGGNIPE